MTKASTLSFASDAKQDVSSRALLASFRNQVINGNFDVWQRGTSSTVSNFNTADRWGNTNGGTTKVNSQMAFTPGQTEVPGNPKYWLRTVVTSVAGASNYCQMSNRIEGVGTFAGKTVTCTFYAKSDAGRPIALEFGQAFGTGGSPSSSTTGINVTTFTLSQFWQKFQVVFTMPSITGKTLGTNGDDYLQLAFFFDAGSTFNSRTNSLGQQSGTFDIARVSLVEGDASDELDPFSPRQLQLELALCQRYYEVGYGIFSGNVTSGQAYYAPCVYKVTKRATPTLGITDNANSGFAAGIPGPNQSYLPTSGWRAGKTATSTTTGFFEFLWSAEAEL